MNCKPGELAIVVHSEAGNEGKIVTCIRPFNKVWRHRNGVVRVEPSWEIDRELSGFGGDSSRYISDSQLRPIRPGDLEDETPIVRELEHS